MARYEFRTRDLQDRSDSESVLARDDDEARTLAEIRLLLSGDFTRITVFHDGEARFQMKRDGLR